VVGQYAFSVARSRIVRLVIGLLFAVPAAHAGYDVILALAHIGIPSEWLRESFAMLGAVAVGSTVWARMSIVRNSAYREVVLRRSHLSRPWDSGDEQVTLRLHRLFVWDRRGNRSSA